MDRTDRTDRTDRADGTDRTVVVAGLGYVGLPLAVGAVSAGFEVVGFDVDRARVDRLNAGTSPIGDVSDEEIRSALASGRMHFTDDTSACAGFDVAIIAVPTPLGNGTPDLRFVRAAAAALGPLVRPGSCVVLESTTYPGTTEELLVPILEAASGLRAGRDFAVGFSPERIDPGNAIWSLRTTPKLVSGVDAASLDRIARFYERIVDTVCRVAGTREAELAKLLENTFRHVNIALVNELATYAHALGIDFGAVVDAAATKPFGFMSFRPGPGVGGHCLPIDPSYLSWQVKQQLGVPFRFVELANDINDHMPDYVVRRITESLNRRRRSVNGARLLVLGLAYKKNSADDRESPARRIAELLHGLGAELRVADPLVGESVGSPGVRVVLDADEAAAADLVVVLVPHDSFAWHVIDADTTPVFDATRTLSGASVEHL